MTSVSLAFLLADTNRALRRRFNTQARALGVSRAQWQALLALSRNEGINQTGLADYLEVETITLCRMVDRLEAAGLVERRADPADRRAWRLHLTQAAHPLLDQLRDVGETVVDEGVDAIDPEALAITVRTLSQLHANFARRSEPRGRAGTA